MLVFDRPWALVFLALIPALILLGRLMRTRRGALAFPLSAATPPAPFLFRIARTARGLALWLGLAAAVLAAAGPALVSKRVIYLGRGDEAIIVLDVSPSMAASDFAPTRLDAAKAIIGDFLATRRNETVGLVAFGGDAALVCPPTTDYASIAARLGSLEPGIYGEGTAIGAGIATAVAHAARSSAPEKQIILLTDGENNAGSMDPATAARTAARFGIALSIIGVGSPGEAPVTYVDPVTHEKLSGIYRSDFNGAGLEALSRAGGGSYYGAENKAALASAFAALAERSSSLSRSRSLSSEEGLTGRVVAVALALLALARLLGLAGGGGRP
ncbi:MAG: VWA domain-containing protein [Rectinemataceae bacterium]